LVGGGRCPQVALTGFWLCIFRYSKMSQFLHVGAWFNHFAIKLNKLHFAYTAMVYSKNFPSRLLGCVRGWRLVRRACVQISRKLRDIGDCLLLGAYRKVATQNRLVTSLITSLDPMTS